MRSLPQCLCLGKQVQREKRALKSVKDHVGGYPRKDSQQEHKKGVERRSKTWEE